MPVIAAVEDAPKVEPIVETIAAPQPAVTRGSLPRARNVKKVETAGTGQTMQISIAGDGELAYKAFRLDNPSRLVIDLPGVKNSVPKSTLDVGSGSIQRVRVAQFQGGADPVARVVIDLNGKPEYAITADGDRRSEERRVGKECRSGWSAYPRNE